MLQRIYDFIKGVKTPKWLSNIFAEIQGIIISTFLQIGKVYLEGLEDKIAEVNEMDIPNDKKFDLVFKWGKKNIPNVKDNLLSIAIEILLALLKKRAFTKVIG